MTIVALYRDKFSKFVETIGSHDLNRIILSSKLKRDLTADIEVKIGQGALLLMGSLENPTFGEKWDAFAFVAPSRDTFILTCGSMILKTKLVVNSLGRRRARLISRMPLAAAAKAQNRRRSCLYQQSLSNLRSLKTLKGLILPKDDFPSLP